jgi:transcriptional regulator with XRE-family HTH domain
VENKQFYQELGRRVAARRGALRITQAEVGERLGVSRASVANIEAGRQKLYAHQLYALARALRLPDLSGVLPIDIPGEGGNTLLGERRDMSSVQHAQIESLVLNAVAAARPNSRKS